MNHTYCFAVKNRGIATLEMLVVIPLLLLLGLGVIEVSRAIQAQNVSTGLAREGANLASRSISDSDQEIMDALALSADPLDLSQDGVIYISVVVGEEDAAPYVLEQHRWINSGYGHSSQTWSGCPSWGGDGVCQLPVPRPRLTSFPMTLDPGETVHVVEVIYDYSLLTNFVLGQNLSIYSRALM